MPTTAPTTAEDAVHCVPMFPSSRFCRAILWGASLAMGGCAAQQGPPKPRSSLITEAEAVQRFKSPASWLYHPATAAELVTRLALPSKDVLFAGVDGERWYYDAKAHEVRAASQLARETLIAVLPLPGKGWLFVGSSGTGYEAEEPLGPFLRSNPPVEPLERVSASGASIAGIRFDGALIQSVDAGMTWARVPFPDQFFADVELGPEGTGVAFSVPEAWYTTVDAGGHWNRADVSPIGVSELRRDPKAGLVALGATSWFDVRPKVSGVLTQRATGPVDEGYKLPVPPPRGPSASALAEQRAVLLENRYLELAREEGGRGGWQLVRGDLGAPITAKPLDVAKECNTLRLAGFRDTLYLACFKGSSDEVAIPLELFSSTDGGKSFKKEPFSMRGKLDAFRMAVGKAGRLIVTGICGPQDSTRGCAPHGVYHKRRAVPGVGAASKSATARPKKKMPHDWELALSAVPGLASTPMAMAFSTDGGVAYLVGQRTKSDNYTMFVSRDQGETFRAREIEQLGARPKPQNPSPWYRRDRVQDAVLDMNAAEDGTISVVIRRGDQVALAVTDDDGRVLSLTPGPGESTTLGAFGTRGIALAPETGKAWETLDGGVSWQPIGSVPVELCEKNRECDVPVRCGMAGCVVGDSLTRLGWRGQAESELSLTPPPQSLTTGLLYPRVRTPLSCTLGDDEWVSLQGVGDAPSAHEAAIGDTVWHLHGSDPDTGAAWAYHGRGGRRPQVTQSVLFPPAQDATHMAFALFDQVEGAAALRYRVPRGAGERELTAVEVAWDNRFENVVKRASLGRSLPFQAGDFSAQKARTQLAGPDIVSIGVGGIYLRPHRHLGSNQPTYFLDGRTVSVIPPVNWPAAPGSYRDEMVHAGNAHLPIRIIQGGATLTRASRAGESWSFASRTIGLPHAEDLGMLQKTGITYYNGGSAFYALAYAASGQPRHGRAFPIQATGDVTAPPIEIAQQLDLADPPQPCSTETMGASARIVVPPQAGTRHPVIISHRIEPIRTLLSTEMVLYGTPSAPCLAALAAAPVDMDERDDRTWMYAIIVPSDLDHAWAFKVVYDDAGDKQVAYRNMRCEFDPKASVPKKIYSEPGTLSSEP